MNLYCREAVLDEVERLKTDLALGNPWKRRDVLAILEWFTENDDPRIEELEEELEEVKSDRDDYEMERDEARDEITKLKAEIEELKSTISTLRSKKEE